MIIFLSYGLFIMYVITRLCIAASYSHTKKICRKLEEQIEKTWVVPYFNGGQIETQPLPDNYDELVSERHKYSEKWRKLYFSDSKIKRYGGILIGLISLILVWVNYQDNSEKVNLLLVMLPPIVNLYNVFFERYEVSFPVKIQKMID